MSDVPSEIPGAYPSTPPRDNAPTFTTLPHPAKTNNPNRPTGAPGLGEGLVDPLAAIFNAPPGPVIPDEETARSLGKALSPEELRARSIALNKEE
ncbi:hypothetical protein AX14_006607 [Amanita brunnescens Koide BX004]|nr:hypothetical protein AX14_006607 [Amanita brunnescens Koide BX004]